MIARRLVLYFGMDCVGLGMNVLAWAMARAAIREYAAVLSWLDPQEVVG